MTSQFWISDSRVLDLLRKNSVWWSQLTFYLLMCKFYVFWQVSPVIFFAIRNYEDSHKLRSASDIAEYILILHFEHPDLSNTNLRVFHTSKQVFFSSNHWMYYYVPICSWLMAIVVKNFYILLYPNKNLWSLYLFQFSNKKGRNNGVPIRPVPCTSNNICPSHNQHNGTTSLSRPSTSNNSVSKTNE